MRLLPPESIIQGKRLRGFQHSRWNNGRRKIHLAQTKCLVAAIATLLRYLRYSVYCCYQPVRHSVPVPKDAMSNRVASLDLLRFGAAFSVAIPHYLTLWRKADLPPGGAQAH